MRNWIKSNWEADTYGKRQVIVAGLLALMLALALGYGGWIALRTPSRYLIVLEGQDEKGHYFTTLAVAGGSPWQARGLALARAKQHALHIVGVHEIDDRGPARGPRGTRVLKAPWDKTYIPDDPDDDEHEHKH